MSELSALQRVLLELGLEDLIPLPEIPTTWEVCDLAEAERHIDKISSALIDLLRAGRIQVWSGHWSDEPEVLNNEAAEAALRDERRYSFAAEQDGLQRVYFSNVDNIRS